MNGIHTLARGSVVIGLVVLGLKYFAYYLTGSVALLSDAIESIVNVATAVVALLAIRWSSQPADERASLWTSQRELLGQEPANAQTARARRRETVHAPRRPRENLAR